jgi:hypothetical protein
MTKRYKNFDAINSTEANPPAHLLIDMAGANWDDPADTIPKKKARENKGGEKFAEYLLDRLDEIGGGHFPYKGDMIWIHTPESVKQWVESQLESWKEDW